MGSVCAERRVALSSSGKCQNQQPPSFCKFFSLSSGRCSHREQACDKLGLLWKLKLFSHHLKHKFLLAACIGTEPFFSSTIDFYLKRPSSKQPQILQLGCFCSVLCGLFPFPLTWVRGKAEGWRAGFLVERMVCISSPLYSQRSRGSFPFQLFFSLQNLVATGCAKLYPYIRQAAGIYFSGNY